MPSDSLGRLFERNSLLQIGAILASGFIPGVGFVVAGSLAAISAGVIILSRRPEGQRGVDFGTSKRTIRAERLPAQWKVGNVKAGGMLVYHAEDEDTLHLAFVLSEDQLNAITGVSIGGKPDFEFVRDATDNRKLIPAPSSLYIGKITVKEERTGYYDAASEARRLQGSEPHARPTHRSTPAPGYKPYTYTVDVQKDVNLVEVWEYFKADGTEGVELQNAVRDIEGALPWTSEHKLNGKSWVYVKLVQPEYGDASDRFWTQSLPDIQFTLEGLKVPDFFNPTNPPLFTRNAARLRLFWHTRIRGFTRAELDLNRWNSANAICEPTLRLDGARGFTPEYPRHSQRYGYDGTLYANGDVVNTESQMDLLWAGQVTSWDGRLVYRPGADQTARLTITQDMVLGPISMNITGDASERVNALSVEMEQSQLHNYDSHVTRTFEDGAAIFRDGETIHRRLQVNLSSDPVALLRVLRIELLKSRAALTVEMTVKPGDDLEMMSLIPGDKVATDIREIGPTGKEFRLVSAYMAPNMEMTITLAEWPAGLFEDTLELPPLIPRDVAAPLGPKPPAMVAHAVTPNVGRGGGAVFELELTWQPVTHNTRILVSSSSFNHVSTVAGASAFIELPDAGEYRVALSHVDFYGRESNTTTLTAIAYAEDIPVPTPTLAQADAPGYYLRALFATNNARDIAAVELRFNRLNVETQPVLAEITEANWASSPRLDVQSTVPSIDGRTLIVSARFNSRGWHRVFARYVNRHGSYGGIADLGYHLADLSEVAQISFHAGPLWEGTANNLHRWSHRLPDQAVNLLGGKLASPVPLVNPLIPTRPDVSAMRASDWNGDSDWAFNDSPEGYYEMASRDLGRVKNVNLRVNAEVYFPSDGGELDHAQPTYRLFYRQAESGANSTWNTVDAAATPNFVQARYIKARVTVNGSQRNFGIRDMVLTAVDASEAPS